MKLKNKLTGEINIIKVDEDYFNIYQEDGDFVCPVTLKELNDGWEDVPEEPKGTYFINTQGDVQFWDSSSFAYPNDWTKEKQIGNYFETREEAEKAVRKLKAWKQLKDNCNFRFNGLERDKSGRLIGVKVEFDEVQVPFDTAKRCNEILYLLFGGEE